MNRTIPERIQNLLDGLEPKDRRALTIVSIFLALMGSYLYILEPLLIRYDQARSALDELTQQQRRFSRQVTLLPRRESKFAEYRSELAALQRYFALKATIACPI